MNKNDGGPAFPLTVFDLRKDGPEERLPGISMRDYFAIHCDQPGEQELVTAAGYTLSNGEVWESKDKSLGTFPAWYRRLSQRERFLLYAHVRYELADAMLAERAK